MGLDISVNRLKKISSDNDRKFILDDCEKITFPLWTTKYESLDTVLEYDWKKFKKEKNFDIDIMDLVEVSFDEEDDDKSYGKFINVNTKEEVTLVLEDIPTMSKDVIAIGYDEIGYQRKGFNQNFYNDYSKGIIGYFVWTKDELYQYKEKYCIDNMKQHFQENIIDKFIEKECCVTFDW